MLRMCVRPKLGTEQLPIMVHNAPCSWLGISEHSRLYGHVTSQNGIYSYFRPDR
jgi:hypothetical protein